jgi:hypothetical protein
MLKSGATLPGPDIYERRRFLTIPKEGFTFEIPSQLGIIISKCPS